MGASIWKWVAAILATAMLAGVPGYIHLYLDSPEREEVTFIRERQESVLQRLAVLDVRLANHEAEDEKMQEIVEELRAIVLQLQAGDGLSRSN